MKKSLLKKIIFSFSFLAVLLFFVICPLARGQVNLREIGAKKVKYTSQGLRDPFKSPFEIERREEKTAEEFPVEYGLSHLQVQGVVWNSKMPQAIINDKVVRIGEVIEGAKILDIRKEGVYVLYEERQYILRPTLKSR